MGSLKPDELMVAYQETMLAFILKVREEGFDPARPLRMVTASRGGRDSTSCGARRHRMNTNEDELLGTLLRPA